MKKNISFLFPGKSRFERLDDSLKGNSPKEFFYGFLSLKSEDYNLSMIDTHSDPKYFTNKVYLKYEQYRNSFFNFGITKQRVLALAESIKSVDTVICFTDAFSLSLGLYGKKYAPNTILIGGFHGLADLADETKNIPKQYINMIIQRCIKNLNHLFFFGEADRIESIKKYKIDPNKTSLFRFGVDVKFWTPKKINTKTKTIFSVGSDPKRDYKTLVNSSRDYKINILTKLKISNLQNFSNVSIVSGNYHNSIITDDHL